MEIEMKTSWYKDKEIFGEDREKEERIYGTKSNYGRRLSINNVNK